MGSDILASFYVFIYLFFVLFLTIPVISKYGRLNYYDNEIVTDRQSIAFLIAVIMTIFIGLRPISYVFDDMTQYKGIFDRFSGPFDFNMDAENFIYDNLMYWFASLQVEPVVFYLFIASIYFMCTYFACRRWFPDNTLSVYLIFLAAFSTFSYATNGIKAGAAASIFSLALSYINKSNVCIPLVLISWGFHHSMQLPIVALLLTFLFKNPKWYYYGWITCVIMAFFHITIFQQIFAGYADEKGAGYLTSTGNEWGGKAGFRIDFVLYSAMPVLVGYIVEMKNKVQVSSMYSTLMHLYLCTNGVWMLCMYVNYTNRIAYLSWFLYPFVLAYPFLNENFVPNKYRVYAKVIAYHFAFTFFMVMFFYGGFFKLLGF